MEKPIIQTKSLFFAQQVYKLCKSLDLQKEYIISKQLLRCGTSIGYPLKQVRLICQNFVVIERPSFGYWFAL